jgi:uncharacterized protein YndB with AHSA1/START domain
MTEFGTVRRDADGPAVRFERRYAAAPEDMWDAWTRPERIARWLGAALEGGPVEPGAVLTLVWGPDADSRVGLVVTALEPPRRLEWEWTINGEPPTTLRVDLLPDGDGTLLVLDHSRLPAAQVAGLSSGWHDFLDVLATGEESADDRWRELLPAYREQVAAL